MDNVIQTPSDGQEGALVQKPRSFSKAGLVVAGIIHHSLALAPFLVLVVVYLLSWRVQAIIGHWPRVWIDDPKFAAPGDGLSDFLYGSVVLLLLWGSAALILLPVSSFLLRRQYPRWYLVFLLSLFVVGLVILRLDPGQRLTWYAD